MAEIDDLISQVGDDHLRSELLRAANALRANKKFGLVYERHLPETIHVPVEGRVAVGAQVVVRTEPTDATKYVVESANRTHATISDGETTRKVRHRDLLVVKPFGEPVFPVLRPYGTPVVRGGDKPFHTVINGENFHALQLLLFGYEGKVDCIYIDPPYNTEDGSWKYNNDFVDKNDTYRHSKWLSMMEKRLRLAKRLLRPDGTLIITIDEHESANLGVLLADNDLFGMNRRQMVTIVMNTAGSMTPGLFSRAEEYAYFCFGEEAAVQPMENDFLADSRPTPQYWFPLHRSRGLNDRPSRRPNLVYPIGVDEATLAIVGTGRTLKERVDAGEITGDLDSWRPDPSETLDGHPVVWPFLDSGELTTWQLKPSACMELFQEGFVRVRKPREAGAARAFTLSYVKAGNQRKVRSGEVAIIGRESNGAYILGGGARTSIPKTTWKIAAHDARIHGTTILRALVGETTFTYPKSPYAVADAIRTVVAHKPNAVVLDFFGGSGTTVQAVAMLNSMDGGSRRSILITNNELENDAMVRLSGAGHSPGDDVWEAHGVFRAATVPRVVASLTGHRIDGTPVPGQYLDGTPFSDGFDENALFLNLGYADPDAIETGKRFEDVLPALWLASGAVGDITQMKVVAEWFFDAGTNFAVLLDEDRFTAFRKELAVRADVTHVWLVTNSTSSFARMSSKLPDGLQVGMLYRDYLRNFRVNTGDAV